MDPKLLDSLGLSDKETELYLAALKTRGATPAALAKMIGIKRTTAYSMARALVDQGLLVEDAVRRPRLFRPADPDDIDAVIESEKKRSATRQDLLRKVAEGVSAAHIDPEYPVPEIRFIDESKLNEYFHHLFPILSENMLEIGEPGFWGFQDASLVAALEEQLHFFWKVVPEQVEVYLLTNLSPAEKRLTGAYKRRHMKYWGEATDFHSSTWVAGDYVIMINTRQHPFYAIEIQSKPLAHDQREVFKNLWPLVS